MSVIYRAIWSHSPVANPAGMVDDALTDFSRWAASNTAQEAIPEGESVFGARTVTVRTFPGESARGVEAISRETITNGDGHATAWISTLHVVTEDDLVWFWVDNAMETDDLVQHLKVGRPRFVDDLLALGDRPQLGASELHRRPLVPGEADVPGLIAHLRDPARELPAIIFAEPVDPDGGRWELLCQKTASRSEGVATVIALHHDAANAFTDALETLAVYEGSVRTYLPAPMDAPADGWRHGYIPNYQIRSMSDGSLTDRLVLQVASLSARRRPPDAFDGFRRRLGSESSPDTDSYDWLLEQALTYQARAERLERDLAAEREERGQLVQELSHSRAHLIRLQAELTARNLAHVYVSTGVESPAGSQPDQVQTVSEAVLAAQLWLSDELTIPAAAMRELDGIDTGSTAFSWGNGAWRGFKALAAFVRARHNGFQGDFWQWCCQGDAQAWPATSKKLAMMESETVMSNKGLASKRDLPVSADVDPSERVRMAAHLKISEGGGNLAPRVYFYDDTSGSTGQIHVGFVGPHSLMPNTKS